MCLAIPARILEIQADGMLRASVGNGPTRLNVSGMLLADPPQVGDYIIVHAGFALHKMDVTEAEESLRLFRELTEAAGETPNF